MQLARMVRAAMTMMTPADAVDGASATAIAATGMTEALTVASTAAQTAAQTAAATAETVVS